MKRKIIGGILGIVILAVPARAFAHCEIPCGIYDDEMRVEKIAEDITTVEKSIDQIRELSKDPQANINQPVRWVQNKEVHADDIRHIVVQYFLAQRIKPVDPSDAAARARYVEQLTLLHEMILQAVKAKQTTDPAHVAELRNLLERFRSSYFGPEEKEHLSTHHDAQR